MTGDARCAVAFEVPAEVAGVPRARAAALRWLADRDGARAATEADVVAVATAVTELVANAVSHGGPPVRLELRETAGTVEVTVTDGGRRGPAAVAGPVAPDAGTGRGLALVRDVVDALTAAPAGTGTCVRAVRQLGDPPT